MLRQLQETHTDQPAGLWVSPPFPSAPTAPASRPKPLRSHSAITLLWSSSAWPSCLPTTLSLAIYFAHMTPALGWPTVRPVPTYAGSVLKLPTASHRCAFPVSQEHRSHSGPFSLLLLPPNLLVLMSFHCVFWFSGSGSPWALLPLRTLGDVRDVVLESTAGLCEHRLRASPLEILLHSRKSARWPGLTRLFYYSLRGTAVKGVCSLFQTEFCGNEHDADAGA